MKIISYILLLLSMASCKSESLILVENYDQTSKFSPFGYTSGYISSNGDIIIPLDKYARCFTERFLYYAIVYDTKRGLIGIDRNEKKLFNAVWTGEGTPVEESNEMILITQGGKYGYANNKGEIIIKPIYNCAESFNDGKAKVSNDCSESAEEHLKWTLNNWHYIDKKGNKIE